MGTKMTVCVGSRAVKGKVLGEDGEKGALGTPDITLTLAEQEIRFEHRQHQHEAAPGRPYITEQGIGWGRQGGLHGGGDFWLIPSLV